MGEGEAPEPEAPRPKTAAPAESAIAWFRKRRSWLVLGRTLGGFGAFIAAIVAVLQFIGGDGQVPGVAQPLHATAASLQLGPRTAPAYEFGGVTDRTGKIRVEVPTAWGHVLGVGFIPRGLDPAIEGKRMGPGLNAAPNVDAWRRDQSTPGVFIGVSKTILRYHSVQELARGVTFGDCTFEKSEAYTNDAFTGEIVHWTCPSGARWIVVAATPTKTRDYALLIQTKLVTAADITAYNRILSTFEARL